MRLSMNPTFLIFFFFFLVTRRVIRDYTGRQFKANSAVNVSRKIKLEYKTHPVLKTYRKGYGEAIIKNARLGTEGQWQELYRRCINKGQ